MNILQRNAIRACTSCQMCSAVCPKEAITIALDDDGFYRPVVNDRLCVDCGLCIQVCYKYDKDIKQTSNEELAAAKLYAATVKDNEIVNQTTSGGIADRLAASLINNGYKVIGVLYDPSTNRAIHEIAKTTEECKCFRGSKYIHSYSVDAFRELVQTCKKVKFAVFGLPCEIYSISKYLERIHCRENCVLIDLYCHGCPSMHVWEKVSLSVKNKLGVPTFESVNWRSKIRGWGNYVLEIKGNNGKTFVSKPLSDGFFDFFFSNHVLNESCKECMFRGSLAYTDIRLGDFWGKDYEKTYRGMSAVSIVTIEGQKLFASIIDEIEVTEKNHLSFMPNQNWGNVYSIDNKYRKQLLALLNDDNTTFSDCHAPIRKRRGVIDTLKLIVKQILCYMPVFVEQKVRKIIR